MLARVFIVASAAAVDAIVVVLTDDDVVTVDETKRITWKNKNRLKFEKKI